MLNIIRKMQIKTTMSFREFPGGLVVRIPGFPCCGQGSIPGRGTEIPQAVRHGQKTPKNKTTMSFQRL